MSFQIALIGSDGLVVGSDRNAVYPTKELDHNITIQRFEAFKFIKNPNESLFCVGAGGPWVVEASREIVANLPLEPADAVWEAKLHKMAVAIPRTPQPWPADELFVCRADSCDGVWFVTKYDGSSATVQKITSPLCIGERSHARFLPAMLWDRSFSVGELEKLARLTLACAHHLNPSVVGHEVDLLTIRGGKSSFKYYAEAGFHKPFIDSMLRNLHEG